LIAFNLAFVMKHVWLDEGLRPRRGEVGGGDECPKDSLRRSADDTRGRMCGWMRVYDLVEVKLVVVMSVRRTPYGGVPMIRAGEVRQG